MIGQEFGHGADKNTAAQLVSHAILGATLAYINGGDPTAGGSAAVASEAAAIYLTNQYKDKKEYQDANGEFQPNLLPEDVKAQIRDLTAGIGAVIGGAVGDSSYNAQLAGVIGQNAVENNVLETAWDVANVAIGANSLTNNIKDGNYGGALVDAAGLIYDGAAAVVPVLPAGASVAIKTSRASGEISQVKTDIISGVTITNIKTGEKFTGNVDLKPTLDRIKSGEKYPHRNDGATYGNREKQLPNQPKGYYKEYVVPSPGIQGPGPQRIVVGRNGEKYYTDNHYETFIRIE